MTETPKFPYCGAETRLNENNKESTGTNAGNVKPQGRPKIHRWKPFSPPSTAPSRK